MTIAAVRAWESHLRLYRTVWRTNVLGAFVQPFLYLLGMGLGFTLALVLMASIRETSELSSVPAMARNMGLVLIIAGSLSLAFMGFAGLATS